MNDAQLPLAALLGLVEGLTEFLPVSSTGHMLLLGHFLNFHSQGKVFEVAIQLGAVLALVTVYCGRLWRVALDLPTRPAARRFVLSVLLGFLPAALIGVALHGFIKEVLFESPRLIAVSLIVGGIVILLVERMPKRVTITDAEALPARTALTIGFFQCLAMVPGVSRSGATIVGALLLGVERKAAAEFSFFLSMPTMLGATAYDIYKNYSQMRADDWTIMVVGFGVAFVTAALLVKPLLAFISRHGFTPFAWYRIVIGGLVLVALTLA